MSVELVAVEGVDKLESLLATMGGFLSTSQLGKVYSHGAVSPYGHRYEHYVQNSTLQAAIHRGRWQTAQSVADEEQGTAVSQLAQAVEALLKQNSVAATRRYVEYLLERLLTRMQQYPPPPANSRYIRTNTLHDSWDTEMNL